MNHLEFFPGEREQLLSNVIDTANRTFGYFDNWYPYQLMYPWIVSRLKGVLPGSHILDMGAGISPLPVLLAERNMFVDTVDESSVIRRLPSDDSWNGWGFFNYGVISPKILSFNCQINEFVPRWKYDAVYSVGMLAHLSSPRRTQLVTNLGGWLRPKGHLLLTIDIIKGTQYIWNKYQDKVIESEDQHGTIHDILGELRSYCYAINEFVVLRDIHEARTDILLVHCNAPHSGN